MSWQPRKALAAHLRALPAPRRLLELFCGNGNNFVALAALCDRALGVELNGRLAEAADANIRLNGLAGKARVLRADAALFSGDWARRLAGADGEDDFNVLLVDPPRAGPF